jgi:SAM-dependent methyltransferase
MSEQQGDGGSASPFDTWEGLAPAWEKNRERVFAAFRPVSEWLIKQIGPQTGQTVLEVAAGPGETGFLAAERVGPTGKLISTDFAPTMVEAARRGADAKGLTNVECRVMDAQQLDLSDASVDGVLSRLGLMLVPDPAKAFAEIRRVLRPGAQLAYAVIGTPDRNQWMSLAMGALMQMGHRPAGDNPFALGGPFGLSAGDTNRDLLGAAGFTDVRVEELTGTMPFESEADYWQLQTSVGGPVAQLAKRMSAEELAPVRKALATMLEPFAKDGGYPLPWTLVAVSAA